MNAMALDHVLVFPNSSETHMWSVDQSVSPTASVQRAALASITNVEIHARQALVALMPNVVFLVTHPLAHAWKDILAIHPHLAIRSLKSVSFVYSRLLSALLLNNRSHRCFPLSSR